MATAMAKRLIRLFGFIVHDAPGEAEAECALLEQHGIVDAVLSEDVDTIMFGCTRTLRNWSSEGPKGSKTPTHVSMYETRELRQGASGLDREGMVLVALMSGGDYLPEGIPGAGVKLACEAARAGFGKSLCQLKKADTSELASWKERLAYELQHNESGFFRTRHKALKIPDDFPNMEVLRYYTHPVVSPATTLERLRQQVWDRQIDIQGLRDFVQETFDWSYRIGAIKFIRVLAPCLLVRKLLQQSSEGDNATRTADAIVDKSELVKSITSRRAHFSTDATPELRLSFIPTNIVGYHFQEEPDEEIEFGRDGLALNSDDEIEDIADEVGAKSGPRKPFNPTDPDLIWVAETVARVGIPSMVESWEEAQSAKAAARSKPKKSRQKVKDGGVEAGSMNTFTRVTKNNVSLTADPKKNSSTPSKPDRVAALDALPISLQANSPFLSPSHSMLKPLPAKQSKPPTPRASRSGKKSTRAAKLGADVNPWTIAGSQSSPRATRFPSSQDKAPEPILIPSSSPPSPIEGVSSFMKRARGGRDKDTTPPAQPRKRRSLTPPGAPIDGTKTSGPSSGERSPPRVPAEKPQRKQAGTGSPPVDDSRPQSHERQTRGSTRARIVAAEIVSLDSDSDDPELPPLSSLIGKSSKDSDTPTSTTRSSRGAKTKSHATGESKQLAAVTTTTTTTGKKKQQQATLEQSLPAATRMTKLYVPSKSQPGFIKEVEVSVDDADAIQEAYAAAAARNPGGRRVGVWRQSDVSCVDLTGED